MESSVGASEISLGRGGLTLSETYHYPCAGLTAKLLGEYLSILPPCFLERIELRPEETAIQRGTGHGNSLSDVWLPCIQRRGTDRLVRPHLQQIYLLVP